METARDAHKETEPEPEPGGLRVATASLESEWAFDGQYTKELALWMAAMPGQSFQESLDHLKGQVFDVGRKRQHTIDQTLAPMTADGSGGGLGVLIANAHYEQQQNLGTPIAETTGLAGQLASRGFENTVKIDQNSAQMKAAWSAPLSDPALASRDEVMLYFSGHGVPSGVLGVESEGEGSDQVNATEILGIARQISAQGPDVSVILDSCHSGGMQAEIGSGTRGEAIAEAIGCLDREGTERFREAFRPFFRKFYRFSQSDEQKAEVDAATAATTAAIERLEEKRDGLRGRARALQERIDAGEALLQDGLLAALLEQQVAQLQKERNQLVTRRRAETTQVFIDWWHAQYPDLLALIAAFKAETGNDLPAPMAAPKTEADFNTARTQLFQICSLLGKQLSAFD